MSYQDHLAQGRGEVRESGLQEALPSSSSIPVSCGLTISQGSGQAAEELLLLLLLLPYHKPKLQRKRERRIAADGKSCLTRRFRAGGRTQCSQVPQSGHEKGTPYFGTVCTLYMNFSFIVTNPQTASDFCAVLTDGILRL